MSVVWSGRHGFAAVLAAGVMALAAGAQQSVSTTPARSVIDLQTARSESSVELLDKAGRHGTATLVNLNAGLNLSFLLRVAWPGEAGMRDFHLESTNPDGMPLALDPSEPGTLALRAGAAMERCLLWPGDALARAQRLAASYAPLCEGRLYLRNALPGRRSALESGVEFLRDHVWGGEQIVGLVRRSLYGDAFLQRAGTLPASPVPPGGKPAADGPPAARMRGERAQRMLAAPALGINTEARGRFQAGQWYRAIGLDRVFASVTLPSAMAADAALATVHPPDRVEESALVLLVAFDLAEHDLGFALGTTHPRLGWSQRVPERLREPGLAGPDGFASAEPLVRAGMASPALQSRMVASFAGGFKREHGAFRHGALAGVQQGSHYGFVEQGVVYSRLVPGLATLFSLGDGHVGMKTWTPQDDLLLSRVRHARQNGVPLVERSPAGGAPVRGALVDAWGAGNWSGSADEQLRSLRAAACLVDHAGRSFLVYAWFSAATPGTMARVLLDYGCHYAMHLDMNALEHTYLALYPRQGGLLAAEHLVRGMSALDRSFDDSVALRFLAFPDNRDFFYLTKRETRP